MSKKKKNFWRWLGFNKSISRLEEILINFYGDKSMEDFVVKQQEELKVQQELQHRKRVREKYNYYNYKLENGDVLSKEQNIEYDYIKFLIEKQWSRS
jgi:hypothetical protein